MKATNRPLRPAGPPREWLLAAARNSARMSTVSPHWAPDTAITGRKDPQDPLLLRGDHMRRPRLPRTVRPAVSAPLSGWSMSRAASRAAPSSTAKDRPGSPGVGISTGVMLTSWLISVTVVSLLVVLAEGGGATAHRSSGRWSSIGGGSDDNPHSIVSPGREGRSTSPRSALPTASYPTFRLQSSVTVPKAPALAGQT